MNPKYTKIAVYAIVAAAIIFGICLILYYNIEAFRSGWDLCGAILKPLIIGLLITYILSPLVRLLENKVYFKLSSGKARRALSVLTIYLVILTAIAIALAVLAVMVTRNIDYLHESTIQDFIAYMQNEFSDFWNDVVAKLSQFDISLGSLGETAKGIFGSIASAGSAFLFAIIISIYFLLDNQRLANYWKRVAHILFKDSTLDKCAELAADADRVCSGYIRGQALDALVVGAAATIAFLIAGIPYGPVIGILTGLGNFIPFMGGIVGFTSLIIICLVKGAYMKMVVGGIILACVMLLDSKLINPSILSRNVSVHPVLVFLALIAGEQIGGLTGMLVAVPCAAFLKTEFEKYMETREQKKNAI